MVISSNLLYLKKQYIILQLIKLSDNRNKILKLNYD